jgi:hypothetical protein
MKPIDLQDYFELLDLTPSASAVEVELAYERAKAFLGPDSVATYALVDVGEARRAVERLEEAYRTLSDPALRRDYEESLRRPLAPAPPPESTRAPAAVEAADAAIPGLPAAGVEVLAPPLGIAPLQGPSVGCPPAPSELPPQRAPEASAADASAPLGPSRTDEEESPAAPGLDASHSAHLDARSAGAVAASGLTPLPAPSSLEAATAAIGAAPAELARREPTQAVLASADDETSDNASTDGAGASVERGSALSLAPGPVREGLTPAREAEPAVEVLSPPAAGPAPAEVAAPASAADSSAPIAPAAGSTEGALRSAKAAEAAAEDSFDARSGPVGAQLVFSAILLAASAYPWPRGGEGPDSQSGQAPAPDAVPATEPARPAPPESAPPQGVPLLVSRAEPADDAMAAKELPRGVALPAQPPARESEPQMPPAPIPLVVAIAPAPAAPAGTSGLARAVVPPGRHVVRKEERASDEPRAPPQVPSARQATRAPEALANAVFNGELLRRVRESKGMTLRELSEKTRIGIGHLENVEADRYDALPVAVYLRGFLMSVARELKLDPLKVAKSYLELVARARAPKS